jgi:hypothetical protein
MKELENTDQNSKSLLANVLDREGDFILAPGGRPLPASVSNSSWGIDSNFGAKPSPMGPCPTTANGISTIPPQVPSIERELHSILEEIRVISDKIRAEVSNFNYSIRRFLLKIHCNKIQKTRLKILPVLTREPFTMHFLLN